MGINDKRYAGLTIGHRGVKTFWRTIESEVRVPSYGGGSARITGEGIEGDLRIGIGLIEFLTSNS